MDITGSTAIVTGGASGIGAAVARALAAKGAVVVVADLNAEKGEALAAENALGFPTVLVNNAGTDEFGFFQSTDEALWRRVLEVNLLGVLRVSHALLPGMIERGGGRIVNVASEAGRVGSSGSAAYSAAKGGVIGFTKALAREAGRYGVLCNAVAPGPIDTPLLNSAPQQLGDLGRKVIDVMVGATVLRRMGEPDEVAAVIAFLCSDDASYVTGQALGVSGGLAMI